MTISSYKLIRNPTICSSAYNQPSKMKLLFLIGILLPIAASQIIPGGKMAIDGSISLHDTPVVYAIKLINEYYNASRYGVKVLSGTTQVVNGIEYDYKIVVGGGHTNQQCDVQVVVRAWLKPPYNYQGNVVKCINLYLDGGRESVDVNDKGYKMAMARLTQRINDQINSIYLFRPAGGNATQQVVNGVLYRFTNFTMVKTTCLKSDKSAILSQCPFDNKNVESTKWCGKVYWNPRATEKYLIKVSICKDENLLGGQRPVDSNDKLYKHVEARFVQQINNQINSMYLFRPTGGRVTKQVVNGAIYRFFDFTMEKTTCLKSDKSAILSKCSFDGKNAEKSTWCGKVYWNPRNTKKYTINVSLCKGNNDNAVAKAMLLGGQKSANWDEKDVQVALAHLTRRINAGINSMYLFKATSGDVTKQVVNGIIYRFKEVMMAKTTCMKSAKIVSLSDCPIDSNNAESMVICGKVYWNPRADKKFTVEKTDCEVDQPSPKATPDYKVLTANFDDDDVQRALAKVVDRINMGCNCEYRQVPVDGMVTKMIKNGLTYIFTKLKMVETICKNTNANNYGKLIDECPAKDDSKIVLPKCSGEVSWHPHRHPHTLPKYDVISTNC